MEYNHHRKENKKIRAIFNNTTIRVYQAYRGEIASEAVILQKFGSNFSMNRMTWIKPSFLWMMYRSGWASKVEQERVLAIDMMREGFDFIVKNAVISNYSETTTENTLEEWKRTINESECRVQWDPEKNYLGENLQIRSIQLGIRGSVLKKFNDEWIQKITDITEYVHEQKKLVDTKQYDLLKLPEEKEYL